METDIDFEVMAITLSTRRKQIDFKVLSKETRGRNLGGLLGRLSSTGSTHALPPPGTGPDLAAECTAGCEVGAGTAAAAN